MKCSQWIALVLGLGAAACVDNSEYVRQLNEAMAQSSITLIDAVELAESETGANFCSRAVLLLGAEPVFTVDAVTAAEFQNVRVDPPSGEILGVSEKQGYGGQACADSISMGRALNIAELRAGGVAVAAVPDDDVACAREIQVVTDNELWEVKVARDGGILAFEESDEDGSGDDD